MKRSAARQKANPRSTRFRAGDAFTHRHPGHGFRGILTYGRGLGRLQPDIRAADVAAKRVILRKRSPR